jgi:hypothetical protein
MQGPGQQPLSPVKEGCRAFSWVIGGCLGLIVMGAAVIGVIGFIAVQKATEVTREFEKRPVFMAANALVTLNPEIELVEADEESESITIREKATGKTITVKLEDLQEGRVSFTDGKGEQPTLQAQSEGPNASIQLHGPDGQPVANAHKGGTVEFPEWAPVPQGTYSNSAKTRTNGATIWVATVTTGGTVKSIVDSIERDVTARGFRVNTNNLATSTDGSALMFSAVSEDNKRTITAIGGTKSGIGAVEFIFSAQERP